MVYGASKEVGVFWKPSSADRQVGTGILRMHVLLHLNNIRVFLGRWSFGLQVFGVCGCPLSVFLHARGSGI